MYSLSITDSATPFMRHLNAQLNPKRVNHAAGGAGARLVQDNFRVLASARHRGHVPHNFYANAARATSYEVDSDGVTIAIRQTGIAQRYFGGTIRPVNSRYLTIPARTEADGRRAKEFSDLAFIPFRSGAKALAEKGSGLVMYWLVDRVVQSPDPSVLPTEKNLLEASEKAVQDYINRISTREGIKELGQL